MLRGFLDFMAKMGLSMREDPPKTVDLTIRAWGETRAGLALSILPIPRADPDALPGLSVVIRNVSQERRSFAVPGWLFFYRVDVTADGDVVPLSPFGSQLLKPERRTELLQVALAPGEFSETEIPVGAMFGLRPRMHCLVNVSCEPADGVRLQANSIGF